MTRTVLIAVHPYDAHGTYERGAFPKMRDSLLSDTSLDHLVLVHHDDDRHDIDVLRQRLAGPYWDGRIILTHGRTIASYEGKRLPLSAIAKSIVRRFPADEYVFWGAEVHRRPKNPTEEQRQYWRGREQYGCVFFYSNALKLPNQRIDLDRCLIFAW